MSRTTIARIERLGAAQGDDWRRYAGRPRSEWPGDAVTAQLTEDILGKPVPNIEALTDSELEKAIGWLKSKLGETET